VVGQLLRLVTVVGMGPVLALLLTFVRETVIMGKP